jgi:hypothetical protein
MSAKEEADFMDWNSNRNWVARVGLITLAFVLGASASAGTLYSWKTEDGTFSYTNEKKRIPAKYKAEAKSSKLKSMKSYDRFTPGPAASDTPYGDRIVQRLEVFHAASSATVAAGAAGVAPQSYVKLDLGGNDRDGSGIEIPIGAGVDDSEPVYVEEVRMRPEKGHTTSRHVRIVKQGGRILAVIKDPPNDQPLTGLNSEDFYPESLQ